MSIGTMSEVERVEVISTKENCRCHYSQVCSPGKTLGRCQLSFIECVKLTRVLEPLMGMSPRHFRIIQLFCLVLTGSVLYPQFSQGQVNSRQVSDSIAGGVRYLRGAQAKDGSWRQHGNQKGGVTGLCTLAMLNAGVPVEDPAIQKALQFLRGVGYKNRMVYSTSLITMVLCNAEPQRDKPIIQENVRWLEKAQLKVGANKGGWGYGEVSLTRVDNSNSQFALLALHEAQNVGVDVNQQVWGLAKQYWTEAFSDRTGAFGYRIEKAGLTGSMTCAGISSLIIVNENYRGKDQTGEEGEVSCCRPATDELVRIDRAIEWMGRKFSVTYNPGPRDSFSAHYLYYYLYGMERAGRLSGRRFFGEHDWYREGAEVLVKRQSESTGAWVGSNAGAENNPEIATALSLLFLSKGKRPVVLSKYQHGADHDWDQHGQGVHFLTRATEKAWKRKLNWQSVDGRFADVNDLLESPVLFISGKDSLDLSSKQKENLLAYVNEGGFIFAEACDGDGCDGKEFDRMFRELMSELFPESPLHVLPPEHPVWNSQTKLLPSSQRPLLGVRACCRTSVIYCPKNLSCFWELNQASRKTRFTPAVQSQVDLCVKIGINVVSYATNRDVLDKLNRPQVIASRNDDASLRDLIVMPKLAHGGGADDAPGAWPNLLKIAGEQLELRFDTERRLIAPDREVMFNYPVLFMHGRFKFELTEEERQSIAEYIKRGGFIFCDTICASKPFADSFRREMGEIFASRSLERIASDHPMLTTEFHGFDLSTVTLNTPRRATDNEAVVDRTQTPPILEGLVFEDRLAIVFSPYDLSCALENGVSLECKGYEKSDAARIGINVILYALQQ